jgi:hypothetical protein
MERLEATLCEECLQRRLGDEASEVSEEALEFKVQSSMFKVQGPKRVETLNLEH